MHFTSKQSKPNKRVALISTPWPLYNRPSIQLGALKAYLRSIYPDIQVEAHHVYLKLAQSIGYRQYHEISNLILYFPGSDEQDVALTLRNIEFALPYRPLKTAAFWLIYLLCSHHHSLKKIRDRFPAFSEDNIVAFLKMMVSKKLMFEENDSYFSLAVPVNLWR